MWLTFYECYAFKNSHRKDVGRFFNDFNIFFLKRKLIYKITIYGRSMKIVVLE